MYIGKDFGAVHYLSISLLKNICLFILCLHYFLKITFIGVW